ncbi:hypothetical protein [Streptomyces sp. NPDC056670]|uniref:hypothetical protein n=1 Tax=Streptomyces sp. NPDC056670 TaxID=3345904 RepID=UPI0036C4B305
MPRTVRTARILLYIVGGLNALSGLLVLTAAAAVSTGTVTDPELAHRSAPVLYLLACLTLALGSVATVLAARFRSGRNGVRTGAIAIGALLAVHGLINLLAGQIVSGPVVALGAFVILNCRAQDAIAYFRRPTF